MEKKYDLHSREHALRCKHGQILSQLRRAEAAKDPVWTKFYREAAERVRQEIREEIRIRESIAE